MRYFGQEVVAPGQLETFTEHVSFHLTLGFFAGIIFGSLDFFMQNRVLRRFSFGKVLLIGTITYFASFLLLTILGIKIFIAITNQETDQGAQDYLFSREMFLLGFYCFLVGFFIDFFREIDKKLGPGNLWKMLKGEFYEPKETERIFMFLDLKGSTTIAEKIGHIQYSRLIQDCFQDLYVVQQYRAQVYQYVGDEAVLTWNKKAGSKNANCLRAYFAFTEKLSSRTKYYEEKYGVFPEFKAGLNIGKIVVAEVGQLKTEIAYHGDTINTAARIQGQCSLLGKNLLISEQLKEELSPSTKYKSTHVGDILLKGKSSKVNVFSIESD